jgi:hypothetical protein
MRKYTLSVDVFALNHVVMKWYRDEIKPKLDSEGIKNNIMKRWVIVPEDEIMVSEEIEWWEICRVEIKDNN